MTGPKGSGPLPEETGHGGDTVTVERSSREFLVEALGSLPPESVAKLFHARCDQYENAAFGQERQGYAKMEAMLNDTRVQVGMRGWLPGDGDSALFGCDRDTSKLAERRPPQQPWWRFVRFRRWLCELIAGRDFDVG